MLKIILIFSALVTCVSAFGGAPKKCLFGCPVPPQCESLVNKACILIGTQVETVDVLHEEPYQLEYYQGDGISTVDGEEIVFSFSPHTGCQVWNPNSLHHCRAEGTPATH